jgi:hypothetical protein
MLLSLGAAT